MDLSDEEKRRVGAVESQAARAQAVKLSKMTMDAGPGVLPPAGMLRRFLEATRDGLQEYGGVFDPNLRMGVHKTIVEYLEAVDEGRVGEVLRDSEMNRVLNMSIELNRMRLEDIVGDRELRLGFRYMQVQNAAAVKLMEGRPDALGFRKA